MSVDVVWRALECLQLAPPARGWLRGKTRFWLSRRATCSSFKCSWGLAGVRYSTTHTAAAWVQPSRRAARRQGPAPLPPTHIVPVGAANGKGHQRQGATYDRAQRALHASLVDLWGHTSGGVSNKNTCVRRDGRRQAAGPQWQVDNCLAVYSAASHADLFVHQAAQQSAPCKSMRPASTCPCLLPELPPPGTAHLCKHRHRHAAHGDAGPLAGLGKGDLGGAGLGDERAKAHQRREGDA